MIVERHYDDEALIALLDGEGSSSTGRDPHLAICRGCSDTLSSLRSVADVLGDHRVWDLRDLPQEGVPSTIASLRSFATAMAADESQADVLVKELLGKIRSSWLPIVERDARFRTEAVARRLIERSEVVIDNQPADAAAMARTAVATMAQGLLAVIAIIAAIALVLNKVKSPWTTPIEMGLRVAIGVMGGIVSMLGLAIMAQGDYMQGAIFAGVGAFIALACVGFESLGGTLTLPGAIVSSGAGLLLGTVAKGFKRKPIPVAAAQ